MAKSTQMLKGLLEGCILKIISRGETYGYAVCETLSDYGFQDVSEGSVYPILMRLEKKKLLSSEKKKSPLGPKRKYYNLTKEGVEELMEFEASWNSVKNNVNNVLED